jgi:hypothetical protein
VYRHACVRALTGLAAAREVEDYVLMRPADTNNLPYMVRVERMESDEHGGSAWTRTEGAVEPRIEDVRGRRGEGNGRHGPDADRPRPSRRRRGGYGAASRKERRRSRGGGRA